MTARSHWSGNHTQALWIVILLVLLLTVLVDAAGWIRDGWLPIP